jgi:hypothetical protein
MIVARPGTFQDWIFGTSWWANGFERSHPVRIFTVKGQERVSEIPLRMPFSFFSRIIRAAPAPFLQTRSIGQPKNFVRRQYIINIGRGELNNIISQWRRA